MNDKKCKTLLITLCAICLLLVLKGQAQTTSGAGEHWVITAYYWDEGWVELASWDGAYLPADLMIWFDAWNWQPHYPAFQADFDNVYAFGDLDLLEGLVDDFNDGIIDPIWAVASTPHTMVYESSGVLNVDIPSGGPDYNNGGGLRTDYVVHGEFDVQIDFALSPGFHSLPSGEANAKLILTEEHPPGGGFPFGAEVSVRVGMYIGVELGPHGWFMHGHAWTNDLAGKLRITRRKVHEIKIDIHPGSCPNPLNLRSKGILPVAILGTEDFDVDTVDPETILLTREGYEGVSPLRWDYEDVATPFEGELCECHELDGDGYIDLTLKFNTQELFEALELEGEEGNEIHLILTGNLKQEEGGTPIEGSDCVIIK